MRISTIIPAYNRADLIGETLRSVLEQDRPPDEVIVVDDGSTDGTPDAVAGFGAAVTLIRQANAGAGSARNAGVASASGEVIHFMDSDDIATRDFYSLAGAAIEQGVDLTYGPLLNVRFAGDLAIPEHYVLQQLPVPVGDLSTAVLVFEWVTVMQPCLIRRDTVEMAGPYRTDLAPSEDRELLYRLLRHAGSVRHTPDTLMLYRVHPENQISGQNDSRRLVDLAKLIGLFQLELGTRDELATKDRRRFMRHKALIAAALKTTEPACARDLLADAGWSERLSGPIYDFMQTHVFRRIQGKLRRTLSDSPYPKAYGGAPVRPDQLQKIRDLGYRLPGE